MLPGRSLRPIRSFVRREGRLTKAQERALTELFPRFGLEPGDQPLDLEQAFGRRAPCVLEIGFGNGESLLEMAKAHPDRDYLGIEVHRPGVGHLLNLMERDGVTNIRVICGDAVGVLQRNIPDGALEALQLFFPDPWPKKRHHKRRIVQPEWVALVGAKLRPGGMLHTATDWEDYARHMMEVLEAAPGFTNVHGPGAFAPDPGERPRTKFEERGINKGHGVWDLFYHRRTGDDQP